jgi:hypothetical protein
MPKTNPLMELEHALAHIRLSPEPLNERLEELKQQYETVLTLLESEFLGALLSGNWSEFDQFINDFRCPLTQMTTTEDRDANADELQTPSAGTLSQTDQKNR